ncbi:MAG TPA: hypothetical protein VG389_02700 [Myxococcota bacterium]|nr:hypothetical protein [Myxococcota bacterium]
MARGRRRVAARGLAVAVALTAGGCGPRGGGDGGGPGADAGDAGAGASDASGDAASDAGASADAGSASWTCRETAAAGAPFGAPLLVSDPTHASFVPATAAHGARVLFAWHEFDAASVAHVVFSLAQEGCVGPITTLPDPYAPARRPAVAATTAGWVVAYEASDGTTDVIRAFELDADGNVLAGPDTVSTPGLFGDWVDVDARGDDEAFAWTDGSAHYFAMRGPRETVAAGLVGTTLVSTGLLNYPRIALAGDGTLHLAWRDGGVQAIDWDVLVVTRPAGGPFGAPVDVSQSPGYGSDSMDAYVEGDGTLDLVWAEQDPANVSAYEAAYATRSAAGVWTAPARYGPQGDQIWTPSVASGLAAVWNTNTAAAGPLYFASGPVPAALVFAGTSGRTPVLALSPDGTRHLVFATPGPPAQIFYAWGY